MHVISTASSSACASHILFPSASRSAMPLGRPRETHRTLTHSPSRTRGATTPSTSDEAANARHYCRRRRPERTKRRRRRRRRKTKETTTEPPRTTTTNVDSPLAETTGKRPRRNSCYLRRVLVPTRSHRHSQRVRPPRPFSCYSIRAAVRICPLRSERGSLLGAKPACAHIRLCGVETPSAEGPRGAAVINERSSPGRLPPAPGPPSPFPAPASLQLPLLMSVYLLSSVNL